LAAEAAIIRKDERLFKARSRHPKEEQKDHCRDVWLGLKAHRRFDVRVEARAALLAYGFIRGVPYLKIERKCWTGPSWERVATLAARYGLRRKDEVLQELVIWRGGQEIAKAAQVCAHSSEKERPGASQVGRWFKSIWARHFS
jgi:hypothetical protein